MNVGERTGGRVRGAVGVLRDRWRTWPVTVRDAPLALALAVAAYVPGVAQQGIAFAELPEHRAGALRVLLVLLQTLPLVLRRTRPAASLVVVGAAFAVDQTIGYPPTVASLGLLVALYSAGAYRERRRTVVATAAAVAYVALCVVADGRGSPDHLVDFVSFALVLVLCWGAGSWMRWRAAAETERRRREAAAAVVDERVRLARELHDVVTHHVTAMVVQADATQVLLRPGAPDDAPVRDRARESLVAVSGTGRQALAELRQLLGLLDAGDASGTAGAGGPGLAGLRELVETARRSGQDVELVDDGAAGRAAGTHLGPAAELALYRVVQEGLTNAVKHAAGSRTTVELSVGDAGVSVAVRSHGPAVGSPPPVAGGGRGLDGLRDRVAGLGGELSAGPAPDGGFVVTARVPVADGPPMTGPGMVG
ncbi:sensor histidine kinase [Luteimicrobium sp. NPDC057192]|uniref:sensor histidine kinase n=1 Tax=Luteimicrobium sp. NPDC057192 TaxID=3346042 RepID=UPI003636FD9C